MSTSSPTESQAGIMDPMVESLIDFSEYDNVSYQSPSLSPTSTNKSSFSRPAIKHETTAGIMPAPQPMNGPSHQYDLYKQQTGLVPGALASTHAVNQHNSQIQGYSNLNLDYLGLDNAEDLFDFNTEPSLNAADIEMDFDSPSDQGFFFGESTVNPNSIGGQEPSSLASPAGMPAGSTSNVGRLWPGMHSQAALAKAQAQQRRQQQQQQQQQQQMMLRRQQQQQPARAKTVQPNDPIVEQKISQLLHSMRNQSASADGGPNAPLLNIPRLKKDEDDMDEDERLLASEEGKKLSSKERRQLRNKVSARAFRSRRKEYITQLEAEIANKVTENGDLRAQNRALTEENKRLSDLTRMLLSSPSFSDFLDRLSTNPQQIPQVQPAQQQDARQLPKDVSAYAARQQVQQQQIGLAMIPEQTMDFSMLSIDTADTFSFQPQVYAVLETPEPPVIDTAVLTGKTSNFVGEHFAADDKVDMPLLETVPTITCPATDKASVTAPELPAVVDEEFENDPAFALYHDSPVVDAAAPPTELDTDVLAQVAVFGGIEPEKALARFELVDASETDETVVFAMARVQRISASLESLATRLELLTIEL